MLYSWQPRSLSAGFGDGHEKNNGKPLRIRSAFATSWHVRPETPMQPGIRPSTTVTKRNPKHVCSAWHAACNAPERLNYPQMPPKPYGLRIPVR